jgi:hypothetical protein
LRFARNDQHLTVDDGRRFYSQMKQGLASNLLMDVSVFGEGQERDLQYFSKGTIWWWLSNVLGRKAVVMVAQS